MSCLRTSRQWRMIVAVVLTVALLGAGCGGDDDDASDTGEPSSAADGGSDAAEASGDSSSGSDGASGGGSADPGGGDFAIPSPDGLVLDALADAGLEFPTQRQLYYENEDFDRVVAFYDDWTSQNGEWARAEADGFVVFTGFDGDGVQSISISPDHDPGAQADGPVTYVLLIASE